MKFSTAALFTTLAVVPSIVNGWMFSAPCYGVARPVVVNNPAQVLRQQQAMMNRAFGGPSGWVSSRFRVTNDEEKFEVAVAVPGFEMDDLFITVQEDGQLLSVEGRSKSDSVQGKFASRFSQSFILDPSIDVEKFSASLDKGVLIVSAPKDLKKIEDAVRVIPVKGPTSSNTAEEKPEVKFTNKSNNDDEEKSEENKTETL